jgi:hypothetical protein
VKGDFLVKVYDEQGKEIATLQAGKRRGINRVEWPMRLRAPKVPAGATVESGSLVGPVVPEGTYTVKLIKDGKEYTGKIQLVGDPTLSHSAKDRLLQQQTVMKLYTMLERLAYVGEATGALRDQINARGAALKSGDPLATELTSYSARLDTFYKTLAATREGRITGEEQLREKVGGLYGDVSGYAGRPTQVQLDRLGVLDGEIDRANKTYETLAGSDLADLNAKLKAKGLAPVAPLSREDYDRRQPHVGAGAVSGEEVERFAMPEIRF